MEELVLNSERLAMGIDRDLEMPRLKRNLSQLLSAGDQLWNRTVRTSANRDASEVRASVLLGARGYDYQKVSRNLDNLVARAVKNYGALSNQTTQPVLRETDIKGFVRYERENSIINIIEETKTVIRDQVEKLYWDTVQSSWKKDRLESLDTISSLDLEGNEINYDHDLTMATGITNLTRFNQFRGDKITSSTPFVKRANTTEQKSAEEITKNALECELTGQYDEAVKLYDSISNYEKVLQILTMLLSEVLPSANSAESERSKLEELAIKIANRYCEPHVDVPRELAGTFYLLVDLMTFFDSYHSKQYKEALEIMHKLKILPFNPSEVEAKSREFNRYPEEIRRNISDILMATMDMLYSTYKELPSPDLKLKAKAIITFAGMIQYKLPSNTIARMIELEVLIN